jgi:hypothetical protein
MHTVLPVNIIIPVTNIKSTTSLHVCIISCPIMFVFYWWIDSRRLYSFLSTKQYETTTRIADA